MNITTSTSIEVGGRDPATLDLLTLTLTELAAMANAESRMADAHLSRAIEHAIRCGEILLIARDQVPSGEWRRWSESNLEFSRATALRWIRIALHRDKLPPDPELSVSGAIRALQMVDGTDGRGANAHPPEVKALALELIASGMTRAETARELGINHSVVYFWAEPEKHQAAAKASYQRKAQRERDARAAAAALERERRALELAARAKEKGGGIEELYSLLRRQQSAVDRAIAQAAWAAEREALDDVARALRRAERKARGRSCGEQGRVTMHVECYCSCYSSAIDGCVADGRRTPCASGVGSCR